MSSVFFIHVPVGLQSMYNIVILLVNTVMFFAGVFCSETIFCMSVCPGRRILPWLLLQKNVFLCEMFLWRVSHPVQTVKP